MFKKVLADTARPLECDESVLSASLIAQFNNAKLLILHVLESNTSIYRNYVKHYRSGEEIVSDVFYQDEVKEELAKNCRSDLPPSLKYEIRIASGVPWMETLRWAREERVDSIVLGAHNARADSHSKAAACATVGSTAERVIKHERCPVMIASKPIPKGKVAFDKIMVGIDFSPSCFSAFQFALDLAQKRGSKLYLFHMLPVPPNRSIPKRDMKPIFIM
jgi:nucleotide-binding universal stress UspA family protein